MDLHHDGRHRSHRSSGVADPGSRLRGSGPPRGQRLSGGRAAGAVRRRAAMGWNRWTKPGLFICSGSGSGSCLCGRGRRPASDQPKGAAGRGSCPGRRPQGSPRRRAAPTRLPDHPVQSDEEVRETEEEPQTALAPNRLALLGAHRNTLLFASGARGARSCSRCPGRCRSHRERRAPSRSHGRGRTRTSRKDDHVVGADDIGHPPPRAGCGRWGDDATVTVLRGGSPTCTCGGSGGRDRPVRTTAC